MRLIVAGAVLVRREPHLCEQLCQGFWAKLLAADREGSIDVSDRQRAGGLVYMMLERLYIDEYRRQRRLDDQTDAGEDVEQVPWAARLGRLDQLLYSPFPLPEKDLDAISQWGLRDRLLLVSWFGLWPRVPRQAWDDWAGEYGVAAPFPPKVFVFAAAKDRTAALAAAMGMKANTLTVNLLRKQHLVQQLPSVREAFEED